MSEIIRLVKNDNLPGITITLTDDVTGDPIDLSAGSTVVVVKFRKTGTTTVLATLACTKVGTGSGGMVQFAFPGATLNVAAGNYEGEIEINFNGEYQTVFDLLKFKLRDEF